MKLPVICAWPFVIAWLTAGASMTLPSSSIANSFFGAVERDEPARTSSRTPSRRWPSSVRFTAHDPVVAPCEVVSTPLVAFEMCVPSTSTGPSRYFSVPVGSQVTSGSVGFCERLLRGRRVLRAVVVVVEVLQVRRDVGGVAAVRRLRASAASRSDAGGVYGFVLPTLVVDAAEESSTERNTIRALDLTLLMVAWLGVPGSETMMFLPPAVLICASLTPPASTRWRMIATDWFSWSAVGFWPLIGLRLQDDLRAALQVEPELRHEGLHLRRRTSHPARTARRGSSARRAPARSGPGRRANASP